MEKRKKLGNYGYTLVEIIIVLAIMVIVGGASVIGLSALTSKPVEECAQKLQIALEGNRTTTMGKLSASITFYADSDGSILANEVIDGSGKVKNIGKASVTVKYKTDDNVVTDLSAGPVTIQFDRGSGSLKPQGDGKYVKCFIISRSDKEMTVSIDALTGRITLE